MRIIAPIGVTNGNSHSHKSKNLNTKNHWNSKNQERLEVFEYLRYSIQPEVSSPLGSGDFEMAHTHRHTTDGHRNLETESAQWANSEKICIIFVAKTYLID